MPPTPPHYPLGDTLPPQGGALEVAPGILWLRLPLPFALDHVNLWLLEDGPGWTLVDTGFADAASRALWERILADVVGGRPITRILCTHHHPDHVGLAGWLIERTGAAFATSLTEWLWARLLGLLTPEETRATFERFYGRAGVPDEVLARVLARPGSFRTGVSAVPDAFTRLRDGDRVEIGGTSWRVIVGRGHAPEHLCLWAPERGVLIAGDQVLPRISPNVSVWPAEPDGDPLADFLASAAALKAVSDGALVLPSHGRPFRGLHARLDQLVEHHGERLDAVRAACRTPRTAFEVSRILFDRELDEHQIRFAVGEAVAHLNRLVAAGELRRERGEGPDRYVTAGGAS